MGRDVLKEESVALSRRLALPPLSIIQRQLQY